MADKKALHVLASGMVLDRSVLVGLDAANIGVMIAAIRLADQARPLTVITSADDFFTSDNLINMIKAKDKAYLLIAEHTGLVITNDDVAALWAADATVAKIRGAMMPKWVFMNVPEGWTIADDLSLGDTRIRRKRPNKMGDSVAYYTSPEQMKKLWDYASKVWAGQKPGDNIEVAANGAQYRRKASVSLNVVTLGCQVIQRFELEQLAKHRGWAFPPIV